MSSSELALSVQNLSKQYAIRHNQTEHITISELALDRLRHPFRRATVERFAALTDVSFDVHKGEVLGVIGKNGAGKSTLLKILTRITQPTDGRVDLWGRVGSLLEVGTGFHPELTGRENIYLNGSILGMRTSEITRQFSAIVEFAGVEKFLDTPVKRYSSGMYVRLAFAVAAHLSTEILLVDEVLAVGDVDFQARCLSKLHEVATSGGTVLFVSHQMSSIERLCTRALLLDAGRVSFIGDVATGVQQYLTVQTRVADSATRRRSGLSSGEITISKVWVAEPGGYRPDQEKVICFSLQRNKEGTQRCFVSVIIRNDEGVVVTTCNSRALGHWYTLEGRDAEATFRLSTPWLAPGEYHVDLYLTNPGVMDDLENACSFTVLPVSPYPVPFESDVTAFEPVLSDYRFS